MALTYGYWNPIHSGGWKSRSLDDDSGVDPAFEYSKAVTLRAEEMGFDYTLIAVRWFGPVLEALSTTAALAAVTSKIHLITAIHADLIQPQVIAKIGANIDHISRGRFHINLVSGSSMPTHERQHKMYGGTWLEHDERYERAIEYIKVIKGMWSEQPFSFKGKYYDVNEVDLLPKPVQKPLPPTFVGGSSPACHKLAAQESDWYFMGSMSVEEAKPMMESVRRQADALGREVKFAFSGLVLMRDTHEEAATEVERLRELGERDPLAAIHTSGLKFGMWGTAEEVAERIASFEDLGVEMALLQFETNLQQEMERFGATVFPLLGKKQLVPAG